MINHFQIIKIASNLNLPEETIEKDYFIELLLFYIANNKNLKKLIFRGGTALKKAYFPDYRFSEDLDFLLQTGLEESLNHLSNTVERLNQNFPVESKIKNHSLKEGRLQIFVEYNIVPQISAVKEMKVDILQNHYLPPYHKRELKFGYQDLKNFRAVILTYDLESILADKISRIFDVINEPRDIYDIWYLLKLKLNLRKAKKIFKEKHGFELNINSLLSEIQKEEYKINWQIRLSRQVPNLPEFGGVINDLRTLIKKKF